MRAGFASSLRRRFFTVATASLLVAACSAPPPPRPTGPTATPTDSAVVAPTVDLALVPAPAGLVGRARAKNLSATLKVGAGLLGAPPEASDKVGRALLAELFAGKKGMRLDVNGAALAEQIAFDAPVDLVVVLPEGSGVDAQVAFSFGLSSLDSTKDVLGEKLAAVGPGTWSIGGEKAKGICYVMQAAGPVPGRLVCAPRESDLNALGPYLSRTLAVEPADGADIVADLDVAGIDSRLGDKARNLLNSVAPLAARKYGIGNPGYDKAVEELARFVASNTGLLLGDVKKIHLDALVDPKNGIDLKLRTELVAGSKSWFAKNLLGSPSGPVPALFWRGPRDTSGGSFMTVDDPAAMNELMSSLKGMVVGTLEAQKIGSEAERKKVGALLSLPFAKNSAFVSYGGAVKVTKPAAAKTTKEKWQEGFDRLMGWYVIGTNQKADAWVKWLKDASAAFNQPGIQKALKAGMGGDSTLALKSVSAPSKLGKGAAAFELSFADKREKSEGVLSLLVAPDGDNTWMAMGFDKAELIERIERAKAGKDGLDGRADLAPFRTGATNGGGFMTLKSFRSSVFAVMLMRPQAGDSKKAPEDIMLEAVKQADGLFDQLPNKGDSPLFVKSGLEGNVHTLEVRVQKGALDDVNALVQGFAPKPR